MKFGNRFVLALLFAAAPLSGATKDRALPDNEMLKMMEFLREMEMIKQMEMIRDLQHLEIGGAQASNIESRKGGPATNKETLK